VDGPRVAADSAVRPAWRVKSRTRLTATVTARSATVDSHRRTPTTVYLGKDAAIRAVVTPEKRKVGGSTPPLPTLRD
jgi:hypothetical protein